MYNPIFEKEKFKREVTNNVKTLFRKTVDEATPQQLFQAVSYAVKEVIIDDWIATQKAYKEQDPKIVYYMSMEFLMGRALGNNLINMTAYKEVAEALDEMGIDLNAVENEEPDAALGNGGLGRLAACFLDSLATLGYAAYGCGIRYRYGMFKQKIEDGYQVETPDNWLKNGNPFELRRPEYAKEVRFGGNIRVEYDEEGKTHFVQEHYESVRAVPYDMPIVGYNNHMVNTLRIWDAEPIVDFQLDEFDRGDYHKAVEQENLAKNIVEVLYPNDNHYAGKELRLKQQYFFISSSIQQALSKYKMTHDDIHKLPEKVTFQMNDTHPTVAVAELMRILLDEEGLGWNEAWEITTHTCAYTNHTIMAEALEKWPIDLFSRLLPRVYQIIQEIDRRFVEQIRSQYPGDEGKVKRMAILMDGQVKMAHLAIVAGYSVNGVAALHTEILKKQELRDFYEMMPSKFNNKTNGITQRRFLLHGNPLLADWVTEKLGTKDWATDLSLMSGLRKWADDEEALKEFMSIKYKNKERLAQYILEHNGIEIDPRSIFDVQVKRLHEYKRQLLNVLHIIYLYQRMKADPHFDFTPRTYLFGAKAAPGYAVAKRIIRLINSVADMVARDPACKDRLQVVFLENYRVSLAEKLMPASELSEQISTAGKEASGTGNMKFMMNGAVTIGTLDGANVEMHQVLGDENIFLFGLKAHEVAEMKQKGYKSYEYYVHNPELRAVIDQLNVGFGDGVAYDDIARRLLFGDGGPADEYLLLADFESYRDAHQRAGLAYQDPKRWNQMALMNIARSGIFAADRSIRDYARDIWNVPVRALK